MGTARRMNESHAVREIPFQPASRDIWDKKYRLKTKSGEAIDDSIDDAPLGQPEQDLRFL